MQEKLVGYGEEREEEGGGAYRCEGKEEGARMKLFKRGYPWQQERSVSLVHLPSLYVHARNVKECLKDHHAQ